VGVREGVNNVSISSILQLSTIFKKSILEIHFICVVTKPCSFAGNVVPRTGEISTLERGGNDMLNFAFR